MMISKGGTLAAKKKFTFQLKLPFQLISSLNEFIDEIETLKDTQIRNGNSADFLFRGQNCDQPLLPKIARLELKGETLNTEKQIFEEFKRQAPPYITMAQESDWDWLATAQHHGLPTRLLDWTYSALCGLWFAVKEDPENDHEEHGVVYIFTPTLADYKIAEQIIDPFEIKQSAIYRPKSVSKRIFAQSGVFTAHRIQVDGAAVKFETHGSYKSKLKKFKIERGDFSKIRKSLNMMGINYHTMFPDLDGLCRHLQWRFSYSNGDTVPTAV